MFKRLALILVPLLLAACSNPVANITVGTTTTTLATTASLSGYFKSSFGDGFEVSGSTFTQYDDAAKTVSFAGTIANSPDLKAAAGTLIVQITEAGTWGKTKGTYYGVRWKSLSSSGVLAAAASAYPKATPEPTSLTEAVSTFAADSYYTYFGEYGRK